MLPIQQKLIKYNYSKRSDSIKYIVIHDTANPGATAINHYNYFNGGNRGASADYFVDSSNIVQLIEDKNYSWAVGDGKGKYGITNNNSVSIEMCLEKNGMYSEETLSNTIDLAKFLMSKYNIAVDKVIRHYDASRKSCPNTMSKENWKAWKEFKDKLTTTPTPNKGDDYMSKIYKNGSTIENTYSDYNCTLRVGYLVPYETAECIAEYKDRAVVIYNTHTGKKVGFVKWTGGIKK